MNPGFIVVSLWKSSPQPLWKISKFRNFEKFRWLKSPWQWVDIFRWSLFSRRMIGLFVHMGKWEKRKQNYKSQFTKRTCFKNYIATAKWRRVITKWSHCKVTSFFFLVFNSSLFVSHENSNKLVPPWLI